MDQGAVLKEVQVAPALVLGVVDRAGIPAGWTGEAGAAREVDLKVELAGLEVEVGTDHAPGGGEAEGRLKELEFRHGGDLLLGLRLQRQQVRTHPPPLPTRFGKEPLLSMAAVTPFVVQNLGKYERQLWQSVEFGERAEVQTAAYRRFILEIFKAKPIDGYLWLHGLKQGRLVHVGTVDAPVTVGDVRQIATEFQRAIRTGDDAPTSKAVDVLGWDFAFELNEVARQEASRAGIDVHFWRIPREVLDKCAVEQGDVRFFELAALAVDVQLAARRVDVRLRDFVIPLDDVPEPN